MRVAAVGAVRNEERHLAGALTAVLAQSHADFNLFMTDDGSTDGTAEILREFADRDPRVVVVEEPHRDLGKVPAFNCAFAAAQDSDADIVVFVHGDDRLRPDSFKLRVDAFGGLGSDVPRSVVLAKLQTMSEDPRFDGAVIPRGPRGNPSGPTIALGMALAREVFPIDPGLVSEDLWVWHVARLRAARVVHLPEVVLDYRIHAGNTGPRASDFTTASASLARRCEVFQALLNHTERFGWTNYEREYLAARVRLEQLRREGRTWTLLRRGGGLTTSERLRVAVHSSAALHRARRMLWRVGSGW